MVGLLDLPGDDDVASRTIPLLAIERLAGDLDRETTAAFAAARQSGRPELRPACRRGCAYCCHQLVPLTTLEAQRIAEHVSRLPRTERRDIGKAVDRQTQKFATWAKSRPSGDVRDRAVNLAYLQQQIPCPFLGAENECRIYPVRPLICRGHHALESNVNCRTAERPIKTIPALDQATGEAMREAQQLSASLGLPVAGGLISTFAPMFRAALMGGPKRGGVL